MLKRTPAIIKYPLTSHVDELPEKLRKRLGILGAGYIMGVL
jgi:hypothetical protein